MYKLKLGTSLTFYREGKVNPQFGERLDELKRLGFDSVDFDLTNLWTREEILKAHEEFPRGLAAIKERGLYLNGIHLPFGHFRDYSFLEEDLRAQLCEDTVELFKVVDEYQPYCYILHGSKEPLYPEDRAPHTEALKKSLKELRKGTKAEICVENLPRSCLLNTAEETIALVDSLDGISVCCDTNHFLLEKTEDAMRKLGSRIKTLHVSDHDYVDERHCLPKIGKIDWMKVLKVLEESGYNGVFNYEVSMARSGWVYFTYQDLKNNYDELFEEYNSLK